MVKMEIINAEGVVFMKLKKALLYLLSFSLICVMFSVCYYLSYLRALNDFNTKAIEHKEQLSALNNKPTPTITLSQDNNTVEVEQTETTVKPTTKYTLEIYDLKTDTTQTQELNPPGYLVGLTRTQIVEYLESYMKDLPLSEYNKGLISYELVSFAEDQIVIKKTYNKDFVPSLFYVAIKDGKVIVYNSDQKSVFKYTEIQAQDLPEEERTALIQGIYINSEEELYSLLESYSS